jgi:nitrogen-specific signal transduction histidine kinase
MVGFAAHMRFVEEYDPSLPPTFADGDQMLQVFQNLLKNAAEAAGRGGTIRIRTFYEMSLRLRRKDGTQASLPLQVEIIDDGPGLPPEIAQDIFEPFVSGRENGTGLGLALVSKIISDHDGWISVDSRCRDAPSSASPCPWRPQGPRRTLDGRHGSGRRRRPHDPHGSDAGADARRLQGARDLVSS